MPAYPPLQHQATEKAGAASPAACASVTRWLVALGLGMSRASEQSTTAFPTLLTAQCRAVSAPILQRRKGGLEGREGPVPQKGFPKATQSLIELRIRVRKPAFLPLDGLGPWCGTTLPRLSSLPCEMGMVPAIHVLLVHTS